LYSAPSIGAQHQFYAYPLTGNGNVAPLFDVESASQNIGNPPYFSNPTDARTLPNGNILISAEGPDQLFVIAPITASGTMTVVGTITNSLFDVPTAVGTDSAGNYYVLQGNSNFWGTAAIMKFPAGANGNVAAVSQIPSNTNGVATSTGILSNPNDIAVRADGTIYATSWAGGSAFVGEVLAFASNANGPSATPIATIAGSNTNIGANPGYVALDGQGKIYVLTRDDGGDGWPGSGSSAGFVAPLNVRIVVYAANANGNVAPTATIEGSNTKLAFPTKMRVDSSGGIYVADTGVGGILYFPPGSNGNVAPTREIFGPSTVFGINDIQFVDL